jgi:hypothetical protein
LFQETLVSDEMSVRDNVILCRDSVAWWRASSAREARARRGIKASQRKPESPLRALGHPPAFTTLFRGDASRRRRCIAKRDEGVLNGDIECSIELPINHAAH